MTRGRDESERMSRESGSSAGLVVSNPVNEVSVEFGGVTTEAKWVSGGGLPVLPPRPANDDGQSDVLAQFRMSGPGLEQLMARALARWDQLGLAEQLAQHSADEHLFAQLQRMDADQVDDAALVEVVAAADRLEAVAHAQKLEAAARLAQRRSMNPVALASHESGSLGVAGDELAVRLRTSHKEGADLVRRAKALDGPLLATGEALARGEINAGRARVIVDGLDHVAWQVAVAVEERVLPRAADRTVAQLRADVSRALIAVDAEEAAERARQRATERRVSRPKAETDGMASMRIEGPAVDVLALDTALHASAKSAKAAGDQRSTDQLRFDAIAGVAHRALETGYLGNPEDGRSLAASNGRRPSIHVTIPLDQVLPAEAIPGAREHSDSSGERPSPSGQVSPGGNPQGDAELSGIADEMPWPTESTGEQLADDQVPELVGYGPISPDVARALAAGGIWRRIVTDPLTGAVLDVGHTRYRPTQAMADHVQARDRACVRPGCSQQAQHCELDHTVPYDVQHPERGGRTAVDNLGPLCLRDHQVKTHGDFELTQEEPGVFEWTTPTGHRYRRERDGTTTPLSHSGQPSCPGEQRPPPF